MNDIVIYFTGAVNTIWHYADSTFSSDPNFKLTFFIFFEFCFEISLGNNFQTFFHFR